MKVLEVTFSNGQVYQIPVDVIIKSRNDYYREYDGEEFDEKAETEFLQSDDYEVTDWATSNMNWEEVQEHAKLVDTKEVDLSDEWVNAEKDVKEIPDA